jgi:hypothetical protein
MLTGAVEVVETKNEGIPIIHVKETSDRNWIACDSCNLVVCKFCCENAESGFCNGCLKQLMPKPGICPIIANKIISAN